MKNKPLSSQILHRNPLTIFNQWYKQAIVAYADNPESAHAMALATSSKKGDVSVRYVLLKGFDDRGFLFYSHYNSPKSKNIHDNPRAALSFYWYKNNRQVRITGTVKKLSAKESDAYFASRPLKSQIATAASHQSQPLSSRAEMLAACSHIEQIFSGDNIKRPATWGGFCVVPKTIEFWQAGEFRMHDRFRFSRNASGKWKGPRLWP